MTGLERNSDVVVMSSYAPLSAHLDAWQWTPNLIWFDNLRVFGTPNYYVQQLFSRNRGDVVLPVEMTDVPFASNNQARFYATASREERSGEIILKAVNATSNPVKANLRLNGVARIASQASATVLTSASLTDENSLREPTKVAPVAATIRAAVPEFQYTFKPYSLTILRIHTRP
jgi:alpha-N-arabinofuranosidase